MEITFLGLDGTPTDTQGRDVGQMVIYIRSQSLFIPEDVLFQGELSRFLNPSPLRNAFIRWEWKETVSQIRLLLGQFSQFPTL